MLCAQLKYIQPGTSWKGACVLALPNVACSWRTQTAVAVCKATIFFYRGQTASESVRLRFGPSQCCCPGTLPLERRSPAARASRAAVTCRSSVCRLPPAQDGSAPCSGWACPLLRVGLPPAQGGPAPCSGWACPLLRVGPPPAQGGSAPCSGWVCPLLSIVIDLRVWGGWGAKPTN